MVEQAEDVEQGALPHPRGAHDGGEVPGHDREIQVAEQLDAGAGLVEGLGDALEGDEVGGARSALIHGGSPPPDRAAPPSARAGSSPGRTTRWSPASPPPRPRAAA